jgi:hypothetical protein
MTYYSYIFAKNGCGNAVRLNNKKVYFSYSGVNGISEDEMKVYTHKKKFDANGWLQTNDFYVVNEKGMRSSTFLKLCQIGNNY